MLRRSLIAWVVFPILLVLGSGSRTTRVDDSRLRSADEDTSNWLMYGRTYDDHRFSPLNQINEQTVGKLGLAWSRELGTTRGLEATPLVEDGIIYTTGSWSVVYAIDARTGEVRWTYDPKVPRPRAFFICCDVVNRGVALYKGKVYVGTLDGRLIALDEHTGTLVWSVSTADSTKPYAITGAPRIAKGMVIIGNAGAEFGVRGYISAFDAETGKMAWRSYTVPGDPSKGFESKAMESAAKNLDRRMVEDRRRRHGLGRDRLRPCAGPAVLRNGQPHRLVPLPSAAEATVCIPRRSWPCTPATANSPGIFKPRPGTIGTTTPRSR